MLRLVKRTPEDGPPDGKRSSVPTLRSAEDEPPTLRIGERETLVPDPSWNARYEDQGELRRGGMSSIHTVYDRLMRRQVAMKVHDRERDPSGLSLFVE